MAWVILMLAVGIGVLVVSTDARITLRGEVDGYEEDRVVVRAGRKRYYVRIAAIAGKLEPGQHVELRLPASLVEVHPPSVSDKTLPARSASALTGC
jgi:hypothetical protein